MGSLIQIDPLLILNILINAGIQQSSEYDCCANEISSVEIMLTQEYRIKIFYDLPGTDRALGSKLNLICSSSAAASGPRSHKL